MGDLSGVTTEALVIEIAVRLADESFIVVCGADRFIASETHHADGTSTVHVKTKTPAPWPLHPEEDA